MKGGTPHAVTRSDTKRRVEETEKNVHDEIWRFVDAMLNICLGTIGDSAGRYVPAMHIICADSVRS
jgi:hypothetical protein